MPAPAESPDLTDDELAAIEAAVLAAVHRQRTRIHHEALVALAAVLAALGGKFDASAARAVYSADAHPAINRLALAAEIARQARAAGVDLDWQTVVRDAHTAAVLSGAAAAAHALSRGGVPAEPAEPELPDPFDPRGWVEVQQQGMAADVAAALARDDTDAELAALIATGAGAQYYLDQQTSAAYLDAAADTYAAAGLALMYWVAMPQGACTTCLGYQDASPYLLSELPEVPHGGCRCFVTPG